MSTDERRSQWHSETSFQFLDHMLDDLCGFDESNHALWLPSIMGSVLELAVVLDACSQGLRNDSALVRVDGFTTVEPRDARRAMAAMTGYSAAAVLAFERASAEALRVAGDDYRRAVNSDAFLTDLFQLHLWKVANIGAGGTYFPDSNLLQLTLGTLDGDNPSLGAAVARAASWTGRESSAAVLRGMARWQGDPWDLIRIHSEIMLRRKVVVEAIEDHQEDVSEWLEHMLLSP